MTPKEKAVELYNKFKISAFSVRDNEAKRCALICVDEIIATCPQKENEIFAVSKGMKYWEEVKAELEKM